MKKISLFIFRRDLRLPDNRGLLRALQESDQTIPCFIFDPRQVGEKNKYRSLNCMQFMIASLQELDAQLQKKGSRVYFFHGKSEEIVKQIIEQEKIDAVYCNRDYTPFSIDRDESIKTVCIENNCEFIQEHDLLLHEPEDIKNGNGEPYSIFTAFYKKSLKLPIDHPEIKITGEFYKKSVKNSLSEEIFKKILIKTNKDILVNGGRQEALTLLKSIKSLTDYQKTHDYPALATSYLSAHLKFGTVSIRETYWHIANTLGKMHPLLRQLYWRDFFTHVAYHSPFVFGHAFHQKYDKLPWKNNKKDFKAWCQGKTGFPIVDAGMRQLNTTGWMHNRVRMIVASFLVKDLHIDWLWGEKYFAQQLVDYDPAINNGNWQWNASTGCDAQPYFRIFNPWIQQKKFDPQCTYIKNWLPELKQLTPKQIHQLNNPKSVKINNYPKPIVDHAKESAKAKILYKESF